MRRTFRSPGQGTVAANGLLDRRLFLSGSGAAALAMGGIAPAAAASNETLRVGPWMKLPGPPFIGYGEPSRFVEKVVCLEGHPRNEPVCGAPRSPLRRL